MASIAGDLASVGVPDLFRAIADGKKTGRLSLSRAQEGRSQESQVYFRDGEAYHARLVGSGVQLGTRLVSAGLVNRQEVEEALWTQKGEGGVRRLGEILVDSGQIPREKMEAIVREQIEDTIFEILRWEGDRFSFDPGAISDEDVDIEVSVENLLMEGARRFREWHQITRRVPTLEAVPVFSENGDGAVEVALTPEEWAFVSALDGHKTVGELANACGFTELEAARTVFGLVTAGLLEVELPAGVELPGEDPELEATLDDLERAFEEASHPRTDRPAISLEDLAEAPAGEAAVFTQEAVEPEALPESDFPEEADELTPEAEPAEAELAEAERLEAERLEAERLEAERTDEKATRGRKTKGRRKTRAEEKRLEAERLEAERLEAERLEAERLEAERLEAERLEAERLEAERLEAERLEAERLEAAATQLALAPEGDRYAEVWSPEPATGEQTREQLDRIPIPDKERAPLAPVGLTPEPPSIKVHEFWGVVPPVVADQSGDLRRAEILADEEIERRSGSVARIFAELASPLDEPDIQTAPLPPEEDLEPEPTPPRL